MHRLLLLRHAKAAWPQGVLDRDRPLADRGRDDAEVAATLFGKVPGPDLVLCSPALRTRQTWQIAGARLDPVPPVRYEQAVYQATAGDLIALVRGLSEDTGTALIVGHEPGMSRTALSLAGSGSDAMAVEQVQRKFPTCAIAVLSLHVAWAQLVPGSAALKQVNVPRA